MNLVLSEQLCEFLYSALLGVSLGVFYDILAVIKCYINEKKAINLIFDTLFWLGAIIALFAFVLIFTNGVMRLYILLGNFFGIFIYKNTISPLFFRAIRIIIVLVVKGLNLISRPIYIFAGWIYKVFRKGCEKNGKKKSKERAQE